MSVMTDRMAARLAWATYFVCAAALMGALGCFIFFTVTGAPWDSGTTIGALLTFIFPTVGILVARAQPRNPIGWTLLGIGLVWGLLFLAEPYIWYAYIGKPGSLWRPDLVVALTSSLWIPAVGLTGVFLILLFPNGRLLSPHWRPVAWAAGVNLAVQFIVTPFIPLTLRDISGQNPDVPRSPNPLGIEALGFIVPAWTFGVVLIALSFAASAVSLVLRFRRSEGHERLQLKWVATAGAAVATFFLLFLILSFITEVLKIGAHWGSLVDSIFENNVVIVFALLPIAMGIAILRHRLYAIDVIITKTIVFGALAAFITVVYVAVVAGVAAALGAGRGANLPLSILATVIVAVAFQPVRERVQRFANRLVYGERATPYEVLTLFSQSLAALVSVEDVLPEIARHTAQGLGARSVELTMNLPQGNRKARFPVGEETKGEDIEETVPVVYQGATLGAITVTKPASEPFRAPERRLLGQLAAHTGVVLHNYRLTLKLRARLEELSEQADNLRRSRERLVTAADTSRRAIERAIRERVERRLVLIAGDLRTAEAAMRTDSEAATTILEELALRTNETLEVLRDLARGIYPPLLADKGLVMALEAHIRKTGLDASLRADSAIEGVRFERVIETSCYFCILEALHNVAHHASGAEAIVTLDRTWDRVSFSVSDEGPGFDPSVLTSTSGSPDQGQGVQAMADRLAAAGGELTVTSKPGHGTTVTGWVPLEIETEAAGQDERVAAVQASSS